MLCWRDLGVPLPGTFDLISVVEREIFFLMYLFFRGRRQQQQHASRFAWCLAVGGEGALVPAGQIRCVHPVGARGHTSPSLSRRGDTAWIHKRTIHFLSSHSAFFFDSAAVSHSVLFFNCWALLTPTPLALHHCLRLVFLLTFLTLGGQMGRWEDGNLEADGPKDYSLTQMCTKARFCEIKQKVFFSLKRVKSIMQPK